MFTSAILQRLQARDQELFIRWSIFRRSPSRAERLFWTILTHLGGVSCSIAAAIIPLGMSGPIAVAARRALIVLVSSHLVVQLVKRTVGRPRPSLIVDHCELVVAPDRFSFPSGHSAAAMSVAFAYAVAYPTLAILLIPLAVLVGASRVRLGVHYPGDVLIGQIIAVLSAMPIVFG